MDDVEFTNDLAQVLLLAQVAAVPREWVAMSYRRRLSWIISKLTELELAQMADEMRALGVECEEGEV